MSSHGYTDTVADTLVSWFGRVRRVELSRVVAEYRASSPAGDWGCLEDFAWAIHILKHHVSTDADEQAWAMRLLTRASLTTANLPHRCPEADCGQC